MKQLKRVNESSYFQKRWLFINDKSWLKLKIHQFETWNVLTTIKRVKPSYFPVRISANDIEQNCKYLQTLNIFELLLELWSKTQAKLKKLRLASETPLLIFIAVTKLLFLMCYQTLFNNKLNLIYTSKSFSYKMFKLETI